MGSIDTTNNNDDDDDNDEHIHDHDNNITHHNENTHHCVESNMTSESWYRSTSSFNDITRDTNSSIIRTPLLEDHNDNNNDDVTDDINTTITDNNNYHNNNDHDHDTTVLLPPSLHMIIIRILFPWLSNDHPNDNDSYYYHHHHHHHRSNTPWYYKYLIYKYDSIPSIIIGIITLILLGIIIGTISYIIAIYFNDKGHTTTTTTIHYISYCFGYIYFIMWSISFYPQCIMIVQRQTTIGLSIDFVYFNCIGFICYTIYNCTLYYNPTIIHQYQQRHSHEHDDNNNNNHNDTDIVSPIQSNDVAFAIHALFFCLLLVLQVGYYDGIKQLIPSKYCCYIILFILICILFYPIIFLILLPYIKQHQSSEHYHQYQLLDYIYFLSYIKIGISCMKYIPQLYSNYIYHTTIGWNIWQIILDLFGGIFSILQLIYDSTNTTTSATILYHMTATTTSNSNDIFNHNLPKFMLGNISILFDILFMIQHYILYSPNQNNNQNQNNPTTITSTTTSPTTITISSTTTALTNDHIDTNASVMYHPIDNSFE